MNTMKKMLALVLALALAVSMTACSDSGEKKDPFGESKTATTEKAPVKETTTEAPATAAHTTEATTETPTEATTEAPIDEDTTSAQADPNAGDAFAAIGDPAVDTALAGTWVASLDFDKLMEASGEELAQLGEMGEAMMSAFKGISMDINLELRADGTVTFGMDEESAKAAMEAMVPALVDAMVPMVISMSGKTEEEFMKELEQEGKSLEDIKEQLMTQINPEDMMGGIEDAQLNGQWRYTDGKLYIVEDGETVDPDKYMAVEVSGDKLILNEIHGEEIDNSEMYEAMLPMEFTRK